MPVYHKTESGWKLVLLMWEKRAPGWAMVNPLYVKKAETIWEALPFGTMLAPTITSPASGHVIRVGGSAIGVSVSAISSSGFADPGAGTQIQIATDTGFTNIVSAYDGAYATSWTSGPYYTAGTYYIRARHRGANLGWGPWSAATWFSVAAAVGTVGFSASTTWGVPYDGTYTIFACGGGGGSGSNGTTGWGSGTAYGGNAGGNTQVSTVSGTSVSVFASGGAGGGGAEGFLSQGESDDYLPGNAGANSTWYSGGAGGTGGLGYADGKPGGGGTGSSPYGIGGSGSEGKKQNSTGGRGGNGGTASSAVWLARGTVLQITIGGGGAGGRPNASSAGSAGVVYITG